MAKNPNLQASTTNVQQASGNDPVRIHTEVQDYRAEMDSRIYGEHRWRIELPNFACYLYFECQSGPNEEAQAKGLYMQSVGTKLPVDDKAYTFSYVGKTAELGPALRNESIPFKQRKTTWKPRGVA